MRIEALPKPWIIAAQVSSTPSENLGPPDSAALDPGAGVSLAESMFGHQTLIGIRKAVAGANCRLFPPNGGSFTRDQCLATKH